MRPFFKDNDFNFLTEIALGSVYRQAADVGEVLTTVDRIHDGKAIVPRGAWRCIKIPSLRGPDVD